MSEPTRELRLIVLAAIVLCLVASLTGARAGQDKSGASGLKVAMVDGQRVIKEYSYTDQALAELNRKKNEELLKLRAWEGNVLLGAAEQDELAKLFITQTTGGSLTDAQKARFKVLNDQSKAMAEEYEGLKNKKVVEITPADDAKLKAYVTAETTTTGRDKAERDQAQKDFDAKANEADVKIQKDIKDAVGKLAKEKGINVVLSGAVAFYADSDITDAVIAALNKGAGK